MTKSSGFAGRSYILSVMDPTATGTATAAGRRAVGAQRLLAFHRLIAAFIFVGVTGFFAAIFGATAVTFGVSAAFASVLAIGCFLTA